MNKEKFGEYIAEVQGIGEFKNVNFLLREKEVKHIRRVLSSYERNFGRAYDLIESGDLTKRIYHKFQIFGKLKKRLGGEGKKSKVKQLVERDGQKCSYPDCKETENLTIDHIKRLNNEPDPNRIENLHLLCPKHHLLKELEAHLFHKKIEIKKIEERIEEIKNKSTTNALGYKVLSPNKFEMEDEDEAF